MKAFFKDLFEYNHHFNSKLAAVFAEEDPETFGGKSIRLFSHILNSNHTWNSRIAGLTPEYAVWETHEPAKLQALEQRNHDESCKLLEERDLQETINYKTTSGQPFQNQLQDILFHIINHSSYHRGQIAMEFRQRGLEPIPSDFVLYKR